MRKATGLQPLLFAKFSVSADDLQFGLFLAFGAHTKIVYATRRLANADGNGDEPSCLLVVVVVVVVALTVFHQRVRTRRYARSRARLRRRQKKTNAARSTLKNFLLISFRHVMRPRY